MMHWALWSLIFCATITWAWSDENSQHEEHKHVSNENIEIHQYNSSPENYNIKHYKNNTKLKKAHFIGESLKKLQQLKRDKRFIEEENWKYLLDNKDAFIYGRRRWGRTPTEKSTLENISNDTIQNNWLYESVLNNLYSPSSEELIKYQPIAETHYNTYSYIKNGKSYPYEIEDMKNLNSSSYDKNKKYNVENKKKELMVHQNTAKMLAEEELEKNFKTDTVDKEEKLLQYYKKKYESNLKVGKNEKETQVGKTEREIKEYMPSIKEVMKPMYPEHKESIKQSEKPTRKDIIEYKESNEQTPTYNVKKEENNTGTQSEYTKPVDYSKEAAKKPVKNPKKWVNDEKSKDNKDTMLKSPEYDENENKYVRESGELLVKQSGTESAQDLAYNVETTNNEPMLNQRLIVVPLRVWPLTHANYFIPLHYRY